MRGAVGTRVEFPDDISMHVGTQGWSGVYVPCSTLHACHLASEMLRGHDSCLQVGCQCQLWLVCLASYLQRNKHLKRQ